MAASCLPRMAPWPTRLRGSSVDCGDIARDKPSDDAIASHCRVLPSIAASMGAALGGCLSAAPTLAVSTSRRWKDIGSIAGAALILTACAYFNTRFGVSGLACFIANRRDGNAPVQWAGFLVQPIYSQSPHIGRPRPYQLSALPVALAKILSYLWIAHISTPATRTIAIIGAIILAWGTYAFIEKPVRRARWTVSIPLIASLAATAVVAIAVYASLIPSKSASPQIAMIERAKNDWVVTTGNPIKFKGQTFYRDGADPKPVLFIGDSNMQQYYPRIHDLVRKGRGSAIYATYGGCVPIPGVSRTKVPACRPFATEAFEFAKSTDVSAVVVAAQWFGYFTQGSGYFYGPNSLGSCRPDWKEAMTALETQLRDLVRSGKPVFLVLNIPVAYALAPQAWEQHTLSGIRVTVQKRVPRDALPRQTR